MRSVLSTRPPLALGVTAAAAGIAVVTLALYPLAEVAPAVSLGVLYLFGVLLVATWWGAPLGVATAVASAAAYNFFHLPPTGRFTIAGDENWVALGLFLVASVAAATVAELARRRATEAEQRRREADLAAELARVLLGAPDLDTALGPTAQRIAHAYGLASCALVLGPAPGDSAKRTLPIGVVGALQIPRATPADRVTALEQRTLPALETLLAAAAARAGLLREVVETRALRRSDELKTSILRAVSHDLRSPLTAIAASAEALGSANLAASERIELAAAATSESARLARLVDKLLDLSRLQAGRAKPHADWVSVEEIVEESVAATGAPHTRFKLALDPDLPLICADAAQLERAFANLLENALRHSDGLEVAVRARVSGGRLLVRIVDRGPGIALADQARIFEPFWRAGAGGGSGLGLAIVRGFVEANGGAVRVESLPGQGTSFVVALPLPERVSVPT